MNTRDLYFPVSKTIPDSLRSAMLWTIWYHQGGSSPHGQAARGVLGIGQHDSLTESQLHQARSYVPRAEVLWHDLISWCLDGGRNRMDFPELFSVVSLAKNAESKVSSQKFIPIVEVQKQAGADVPTLPQGGAAITSRLLDEVRRGLAGGGRLRNAQSKLKAASHHGYSESDDGSLLVVNFADRVVVCGIDGLTEYITPQSPQPAPVTGVAAVSVVNLANPAADAFERGYKYLQDRMESLERHGWAHDCDDEIQQRIRDGISNASVNPDPAVEVPASTPSSSPLAPRRHRP